VDEAAGMREDAHDRLDPWRSQFGGFLRLCVLGRSAMQNRKRRHGDAKLTEPMASDADDSL
jgi:hypothetical protein